MKSIEQKAFEQLLIEQMPRVNKNLIKEFIKTTKLFTMNDFLNKYNVLNNSTIDLLRNDVYEFMFS